MGRKMCTVSNWVKQLQRPRHAELHLPTRYHIELVLAQAPKPGNRGAGGQWFQRVTSVKAGVPGVLTASSGITVKQIPHRYDSAYQ